jgi:ribonuclease P protein component
MVSHTFKKFEKLKSKKLIDKLFESGKYFFSFPYKINYFIKPANLPLPEAVDFSKEHPIQFGIAVSTKHFKHAVDRNRIKRLTREAWRLQKHKAYKQLNALGIEGVAVFFVYTQKDLPNFNAVSKAVELSIEKLVELLAQEHEYH